uniref:Uncharacterized protein n=1 Tax=Trichuris muris TaxID=70415 RepID=A0A5S6Q4X1_TRIMR
MARYGAPCAALGGSSGAVGGPKARRLTLQRRVARTRATGLGKGKQQRSVGLLEGRLAPMWANAFPRSPPKQSGNGSSERSGGADLKASPLRLANRLLARKRYAQPCVYVYVCVRTS